MDSPKEHGMNGAVYPDANSIVTVIERCSCDRERAISLLRQSKNDPERAIKYHEMLSRYRGKLSPRPSQGAPTTPNSEASQPPELNEQESNRAHSPTDRFANRWMRKPSGPSLDNSGYFHRSDALSPEAHTDAPYPSFLSPSQNSDFNETAEALKDRLAGLGPYEELPEEDPGPELDASKHESPSFDPPSKEESEPEWNFVLPMIPLSQSTLAPNSTGTFDTFNLRDLIGAMQNGAALQMIPNYLDRFDRAKIEEQINDEVEGFPAIFYVVETNKEEILRMWIAYGGDLTATHKRSGVPLLAFAIMHSENIKTDTTLMTATLLGLGASPNVIPSAFYTPYLQDLPDTGPNDDRLKDLGDENKKWCIGAARQKIARTATLSQRYYLERAATTKKPSIRQTQVAQKRHAEPLLGIANFLIGQTMAAKALLDKLLSHLTVPSKKPLVLVFAGPSGHGKTELARRLGSLLSLELEVVDCTIFNREIELFGPRQPYVGWDKGSRLNNFLANNHEKRCIVFLDEFEKTNAEIHKTLLLPFDNGEYQDRRSQDKINCSRTIWILATNAHDPIIQDFSSANHRVLFVDSDETEKDRLIKQLSKQVKQDFLAHHGSPITGRISAFVPFLPFSTGEQAVIVHKHLLELGRNVCTPVNLTEGEHEQLIGNVRLRIRRDASVCRILAQSEYHTDLGARSLISAVDTIKTMMVEAYLGVDEEITEGAGMSEFILDVNGGEVVVNIVQPPVR